MPARRLAKIVHPTPDRQPGPAKSPSCTDLSLKAWTWDQIGLDVYSSFVYPWFMHSLSSYCVPGFNAGAGDSVLNNTRADLVLTVFSGRELTLTSYVAFSHFSQVVLRIKWDNISSLICEHSINCSLLVLNLFVIFLKFFLFLKIHYDNKPIYYYCSLYCLKYLHINYFSSPVK